MIWALALAAWLGRLRVDRCGSQTVPHAWRLRSGAGSANRRSARRQAPSRPAPAPPRGPRSAIDGYALVGTALALRGTPYRDGGTDPSGFDCSGFTQYVFAQHGVALPREVRDQFRVGKSVKPRSWRRAT